MSHYSPPAETVKIVAGLPADREFDALPPRVDWSMK